MLEESSIADWVGKAASELEPVQDQGLKNKMLTHTLIELTTKLEQGLRIEAARALSGTSEAIDPEQAIATAMLQFNFEFAFEFIADFIATEELTEEAGITALVAFVKAIIANVTQNINPHHTVDENLFDSKMAILRLGGTTAEKVNRLVVNIQLGMFKGYNKVEQDLIRQAVTAAKKSIPQARAVLVDVNQAWDVISGERMGKEMATGLRNAGEAREPLLEAHRTLGIRIVERVKAVYGSSLGVTMAPIDPPEKPPVYQIPSSLTEKPSIQSGAIGQDPDDQAKWRKSAPWN